MELSHFGAKVIYPPTMQPALNKKIPLRVKNTFNPDFKGTLISSKKGSNKYLITGISSIDDIALIQIQGSGMIGVAGIAERIFNSLAKKKINIILISQASSEHSICMAILPDHKEAAKKALETELEYELKSEVVSEISIESDLAIIAVVGENMRKRRGIAGRVFQSLGNNGINISAIAQGSSELNISMVIARQDETKALNALHDSFFLSGIKTLNLYLVGTGLIGKKLLEQIDRQKQMLSKEFQTSIKLIGMANSKKMVFEEQGIEASDWPKILSGSEQPTDINKYIKNMKAINLPNSIFVDCTMEDSIAENYLKILGANISIVTPNKKANAKEYAYYAKLREYVTRFNVKFLYETNVGAALPIINTIKELVSSGDRVLQIEGILSGTMSYIFNSFTGEKAFSTVVKEAMEKGLTEPDPREDLNGQDVARKLLILIREAGYQKELSEIQIENLIPPELRTIRSVEKFLNALQKFDSLFEAKRQQAEMENKVLRYVAQFGPNKAKVSLAEIDSKHPFYHICGCDNIIALYTRYYHESPLVIRGPGAGPDVTAAGVLADIIKISRYSN
jgi:aspartokinase/homoserine dehydrogenase 1